MAGLPGYPYLVLLLQITDWLSIAGMLLLAGTWVPATYHWYATMHSIQSTPLFFFVHCSHNNQIMIVES